MGLDDLFQGFQGYDFPRNASIVYAIGIRNDKGFFPFYIGESGRQLGRMGDYVKTNMKATTDFHVGEAIKIFHSIGPPLKIEVLYKVTEERKHKERSFRSK